MFDVIDCLYVHKSKLSAECLAVGCPVPLFLLPSSVHYHSPLCPLDLSAHQTKRNRVLRLAWSSIALVILSAIALRLLLLLLIFLPLLPLPRPSNSSCRHFLVSCQSWLLALLCQRCASTEFRPQRRAPFLISPFLAFFFLLLPLSLLIPPPIRQRLLFLEQ